MEICKSIPQVRYCIFSSLSSHQRNLKCDKTIKQAKAESFHPLQPRAQLVPEVGNLMCMSKTALVPNSYESVKIKLKILNKKAHENSCKREYFLGLSLAGETILKACFLQLYISQMIGLHSM